MPNWKKIIVSGSDASLSSLYIDGNLTASAAYLTSASIGHLETIYETASVIYSSGSTKFGDTSDDTHEFTGSIYLSGSLAELIYLDEANGRVGIKTDTPQYPFHYVQDTGNALAVYEKQGGAAIFYEAQDTRGAIGTVASHPLLFAINSGEVARINTSGVYEGDLSGSLTGTASIAVTSSHTAGTASIADLATTASHALTSVTASHALTAVTASHTAGTASIANNAVTSSHTAGTASIANTATTSSYTLTGDGVFSGSFSGSFQGDASELDVNPFPFTGSGEMQGTLTVHSDNDYIDDYVESYFAGTAINSDGDVTITGSIFSPYINADGFTGSLSGSFTGSGIIDSASLAETASYFNGTVTSASLAETASYYGGSVTSASFAETASFVEIAQTASYYGGSVISASLAETASYFNGTVTSASFADSSSLAVTASHAITASYATNAGASAYSEAFTDEGALNISHSLGTKNVGVFLYDSNDYLFQASSIRTADINVVNVVFASTGSGRIVIIP